MDLYQESVYQFTLKEVMDALGLEEPDQQERVDIYVENDGTAETLNVRYYSTEESAD